jgi:hypothetical protein
VCRSKNAGVAGYAEAFRPVQSDSQTSEWYSYFENDVLVKKRVFKPEKKWYCYSSTERFRENISEYRRQKA